VVSRAQVISSSCVSSALNMMLQQMTAITRLIYYLSIMLLLPCHIFFIQPDSGHFEASTILIYFSYESWPIVLVTKIPDCVLQTRYCYSIREDLVTTWAPTMLRASC
jgi:hypothetical protein